VTAFEQHCNLPPSVSASEQTKMLRVEKCHALFTSMGTSICRQISKVSTIALDTPLQSKWLKLTPLASKNDPIIPLFNSLLILKIASMKRIFNIQNGRLRRGVPNKEKS